MEGAIAQLLVSLAFGGVCAAIANSRGRSEVGWFVAGFFLSCIAVFILLVIPDLNEQRGRDERLRLENRRFRERLHKDRQVADARYSDVARRLSAHDRALALDTAPPDDGPPELLPDGGAVRTERAPTGGERWWWVEHGERRGPVGFDELRRLWLDGALDVDTLVWRSGMTDWRELADVPDLAERLGE